MKKKERLGILEVVVVTFIIISFSIAAQTAPVSQPIPKIVAIGTYMVGSAGYLVCSAFGNAIKQKAGIEVRVIPLTTELARYMSLENKETDLIYMASTDNYYASRGLEPYEKLGIARIRAIWGGGYTFGGLAVRGDSDIKTLKDLKGRTIATWVGGETKQTYSALAFAGLKPTDVKHIYFAYPQTCFSVRDGKADATWFTPLSPATIEIENSPHGLRFLEYGPPEEKEAWARYNQYNPVAFPYRATIGAYVSKHPTWMPCARHLLTGYDFTSEDFVYTIVKALDEGCDIYRDVKKPDTAWYNLRETLELGWKGNFNAWHSGFIKYAKEKGAWTSEHENLQKKFLKEEEERIKEKGLKK